MKTLNYQKILPVLVLALTLLGGCYRRTQPYYPPPVTGSYPYPNNNSQQYANLTGRELKREARLLKKQGKLKMREGRTLESHGDRLSGETGRQQESQGRLLKQQGRLMKRQARELLLESRHRS